MEVRKGVVGRQNLAGLGMREQHLADCARVRANARMTIHACIYSFIPEMPLECLLCDSHSSKHWRYSHGTADKRPAHPPQGLYFHGGARQTNKSSVRCLGCQTVIVLWRKIKQGREKRVGPS